MLRMASCTSPVWDSSRQRRQKGLYASSRWLKSITTVFLMRSCTSEGMGVPSFSWTYH